MNAQNTQNKSHRKMIPATPMIPAINNPMMSNADMNMSGEVLSRSPGLRHKKE